MRSDRGQIVGVREFKAALSRHLRRVRDGGSLLITDRGTPIARVIPAVLPEGLAELVREGHVTPAQAGVPQRARSVRLRGSKTAAALVIEDRREPWERGAPSVTRARRRVR